MFLNVVYIFCTIFLLIYCVQNLSNWMDDYAASRYINRLAPELFFFNFGTHCI